MPIYSNYRGTFPTMSDLVRREDENRKASARAEARLTHGFTHAKGIDGAKKYTLSVHRREKEQVRQELHNIKNAYNRNNVIIMQNPGALKYANPTLADDIEEQEYLRSQENKEQENRSGIPKDYGRNFFGYKSQPGSNRPQFQNMKAIKDKYSTVRNYYEYKGPKQMDKKTREKLTQQKMKNMSVQEKVRKFSVPEKSKKDAVVVGGYQAESVTRDTFTEKKPEDKTDDPEHVTVDSLVTAEKLDSEPSSQENESLTYRKSLKNSPNDIKIPQINQHEEPPKVTEERHDDLVELPPQFSEPPRRMSRASRNEASSVITSTMSLPLHRASKPKTALELVFDADTYAPDGRLRTMHTLPDVDKAYREARQARYVRTKYKRDVEKELSINEIFGR